MKIKKLNQNEIYDFKKLIDIFKDVFENDEDITDDRHLSSLLENPDFMVFVVTIDGKVVGGLTIYILHRYDSLKPIAYIYDLGIDPGFQRQGLGKALMAEVCNFCRENNFEDVYVEAESDDMDAVNFYRKTKFSKEMSAIHFTYSFNTAKQKWF